MAGAVIVVAGTTAALGMFDDSTPDGPPLPACRPLTAAAIPVLALTPTALNRWARTLVHTDPRP